MSNGLETIMAEISNSPMMLAYLDANFRQGGGEGLQALLAAVDDSDFSLRQWLEALMILGQWLDVRGLFMPLEEKIGYICCAAESVGAGATMTHLSAIVEEMLETYGCERAVKV